MDVCTRNDKLSLAKSTRLAWYTYYIMPIIIMFTVAVWAVHLSTNSSSPAVVVAVCSLYLVVFIMEMCLCLIFYLQSTWESRQTLHIMHIIVCWMNLYTHPFLCHHLIYFSFIHSFHLLIYTHDDDDRMPFQVYLSCLLVCRKKK